MFQKELIKLFTIWNLEYSDNEVSYMVMPETRHETEIITFYGFLQCATPAKLASSEALLLLRSQHFRLIKASLACLFSLWIWCQAKKVLHDQICDQNECITVSLIYEGMLNLVTCTWHVSNFLCLYIPLKEGICNSYSPVAWDLWQ